MRPIYRDRLKHTARRQTRGEIFRLTRIRVAFLAVVGLFQVSCIKQEEAVTQDASTSEEVASGTDTLPVDCVTRPDVNADGQPNGYEVCDNGRAFRSKTAQCTIPAPNEGICTGKSGNCERDADCNIGPNGRCESNWDLEFGEILICGCSYYCPSDDECETGQVCECLGAQAGQCRTSNCQGPEDCESGICEYSNYRSQCSDQIGFFCRSEEDTCITVADCSTSQCSSAFNEERWACHDIPYCN
jgi:hypothetical protein